MFLLRKLYKREFIWMVPNDDNRAADGRDLRYEFRDRYGFKELDPEWMGLGCSVLEMLIALSNTLAFEAEQDPGYWFWVLLDNLGLDNKSTSEEINEVLETFIWRTYSRTGHGGLFPLKDTIHDQREVELWYQLCEYVIERM